MEERDTPPETLPVGPSTDPDVHKDPEDPAPALSDEALDTQALGEGGPSGA
jgi:hypothetical protein